MKTPDYASTTAPLELNSNQTLEGIIDLRSDTVTKPTPAMRAAMAAAEVGDDVYGEDPTVNRLEARAAEIFGKEAAIFVPTGTMGNQIAIRLHTQPGQEVVCESRSHIVNWEMGMAATYSGVQLRTIPTETGILSWKQIEANIFAQSSHRSGTGLIEIENTHNMAGGVCTNLETLTEIWAGAKASNLPTHLDGARVFNAAVALGTDVKTLTAGFDTVMFCLSKGMSAPVGSMLVGSAEQILRARNYRKALGGGMRQAGILAAAGLLTLEEDLSKLADDHTNARLLAETVAQLPGVRLDLSTVQTNIVIFHLENSLNPVELVAKLRAKGLLCSPVGAHAVRLVTHQDVPREACERAARILTEVIG